MFEVSVSSYIVLDLSPSTPFRRGLESLSSRIVYNYAKLKVKTVGSAHAISSDTRIEANISVLKVRNAPSEMSESRS